MSETTAPAPRKTKVPRINVRRRTTQWLLAPLVIITIGLGWKYPLVGLIVPTVMLIGIIGGIIRGRYVCGNLCPRGSFLDRMIAPISLKRPIPEFLRKPAFRWIVLAAMMGFMVFRISQNPSDIMHWGRVFWVMCLATTAIGVVLGVLVHPRAWCSFCPMGTMQSKLGGHKHTLQIDGAACKSCGLCAKACPFGLSPMDHKDAGILEERDCLKCAECTAACPIGALTFPSKGDQAREKAA
ncbi:MAG: 4Fe-4S binding protein [Armatimonadetes bacterium]|nr:4Fe-4S binding protein [Armatimonadota bacterium]MDI9586192.1 4Fe-4S binding protein [Acidobacteriota bacterium]